MVPLRPVSLFRIIELVRCEYGHEIGPYRTKASEGQEVVEVYEL